VGSPRELPKKEGIGSAFFLFNPIDSGFMVCYNMATKSNKGDKIF
jgi:hypothetical protein